MNNKYHILFILVLLLGIGFLIMGITSGEVNVGLFLIFPVLYGTGWCGVLGVMCIIIAMMMLMIGFVSLNNKDKKSYESYLDENVGYEESKKKVKGGGVVLIGPIPIVFGSNWRIAAFLLILTIILIALVSVLFYF